MFNLFNKDPVRRLQKKYHDTLKQAMDAQRNGNIRSYANLSEEADKLLKSIEQLRMKKTQ